MKLFHDSRDINYRTPFGAASSGTDILLSLSVTEAEMPGRVYIEIRRDDRDDYRRFRIGRRRDNEKDAGSVRYAETVQDEQSGQPAADTENVSGIYSIHIKAPDRGCLLWYRFRVEADGEDGKHVTYYCNNDECTGGAGEMKEEIPEGSVLSRTSEESLKPYQITVYRKAPVPEWYKNGIVYQIFPDRFSRDENWKERCEEAVKAVNERRTDTNRIVEEDWEKPAYYVRGDGKKVTGWPIYGGSLKGIEEKLDYLRSLGVTAIYLNPVFQATSNHRYDTGDYMRIDPALGTEEDFRSLAGSAREKGIRLILDGVFSHTGADSIYFDKYGNYGGGKGAWLNEDSPYRSWYKFDDAERIGYKSWWGVEDLPEVEENDPGYREFILGRGGVVRHWLDQGASGWRLDVADELPDSFIKALRTAVKTEKEDAVLIGEVWEDASNKISYGERREYFGGDELDGTMNYPLRTILLDYINYTIDSDMAGRKFMSLAENYPEENLYGALNLIGSHDRERILTLMAAKLDRGAAVKKVKMLSALQYSLPGVPCVYYGDEAGLQGGADPDNRSCFPWKSKDPELEYHYRMLGLIYNEHPVLKGGSFAMLSGQYDVGSDILAFVREDESERILVLANRSYGPSDADLSGAVDAGMLSCGYALDLMDSKEIKTENGSLPRAIHMDALSVRIICMPAEAPLRSELGRTSGVICHMNSLGEGALGKRAEGFVDYVVKAGFGIWQMLPIGPIGLGDSPYVSTSAFAGEPRYVSRDITFKEATEVTTYDDFVRANDYWLAGYTAFTVIKEMQDGRPWYEWPDEYKFADPHEVLDKLTAVKGDRIRELMREQYLFCVEWQKLREYAHSRGVRLMGDIPIYMGLDSADVWANKEIFQLDGNGRMKVHAGVPPDDFSEEGQDWGNPLYDWDALEDREYDWWMKRLRQCAERFDILRIDHFRGLSEYFAIPDGGKPKDGMWQHGPGLKFFRAVRKMLDELRVNEGVDMKLLAEDLGFLDAGVKNLLKLTGLPGMDIWQFTSWEMMGMSEEEASNRAFYTGTHDNNTLMGFFTELKEDDQLLDPMEESEKAVRKIYESPAPMAMVQLQDVLLLGEEARMNVPGVPEGNWMWQIPGGSVEEAFPDADDRAEWFRALAQKTGRL